MSHAPPRRASRLAFLQRLSQTDHAPPSPRLRPGDTLETFFPLQRYRLWCRGKRGAQAAGRPTRHKLLMSYRTREDAEAVAARLSRAIADDLYDVEDAGADALACINHWSGEIRPVTAGEWQARWPHIPLPEAGRPDTAPKGDALEHAA